MKVWLRMFGPGDTCLGKSPRFELELRRDSNGTPHYYLRGRTLRLLDKGHYIGWMLINAENGHVLFRHIFPFDQIRHVAPSQYGVVAHRWYGSYLTPDELQGAPQEAASEALGL